MYEKVIQALDSCGLTEEYKTKFEEHEMGDDAVILAIEDESLAGIWKELIPKLSHRVKFICAFKKNNSSKTSIMKESTVDSATNNVVLEKVKTGSVDLTMESKDLENKNSLPGDDMTQASVSPTLSSDEKETETIVKQVRGILNKLTPENHDKLSQKFLNLELNDRDDRISAVIDVVFEKAIDEPSFSTAYARMVHYVCSNSQETAKKFRKEILDQCQKEFQKTNKDEDEIKAAEAAIQTAPEEKKVELKAELEEKLTEMRRRSLGNVRFIGELYKLQMLTPKIMVGCVYMLLANQDEESYECLCKLLTTVGQKLDNQLKDQEGRVKHAKQNNQPLPKFISEDKFMDKTIDKLRKLSNTANLSSRIRFALLDLVELRQNDWKPRRDANAPKTIDEVRTDAIRQEQEEKNKIDALPNAIGSRRTALGPQPMSTQGKKGSEWNTIPSNKSSRFQSQAKKPMESQASPVLMPPTLGGAWQTTGSRGSSSNKQQLPPRFQQNQQNQQNNNNSGYGQQQQQQQGQQQQNSHGHMQHNLPSRFGGGGGGGGSGIITPTNRFNALQSMAPAQPIVQNVPSSQPPQYQQQSSTNIPESLEEPSPEVNETVKNIFQEYFTVKSYDDTLHWIKDRFPGPKVQMFVNVLARQVGEMSKADQQCVAGQLVKMLIKQNIIPREHVLKVLTLGLIPDIPDIQVDCPKVLNYVGVFVLEVFGEEPNLNWLIELTKPLKEDYEQTLEEFIKETIEMLKRKKTEEHVKSLLKNTNDKGSIPQESLPWSDNDGHDTLVSKMVPVLRNNENVKDIFNIFQENSWDVREIDTRKAAVEAIFQVCFIDGKWDLNKLDKYLPLIETLNTIFSAISDLQALGSLLCS